MLAVVVSRSDSASVHVGEHLRDLADWREHTDSSRPDAEGGGTVLRSGERGDDPADANGTGADDTDRLVELREFDDLHLDLDGVADAFGRIDGDGGRHDGATDAPASLAPDLLVFASRHAGETGPLLTAHHTGNFGPAEYGGSQGALARACPNAHRRVLAALDEYAPPGYAVGMECTHHGPSAVGAPSMFVEVGSAEEQWDDPEAARAVARAILGLRGVPADAPPEADGEPGDGDGAGDRDGPGADSRRQLVGFGGGHYAPRFERVARETDWAVGHVGADWGLDAMGDPAANREVVRAAFERSGATRALLDGEFSELEAVVADLGYRIVSETWVRETSGVPLDRAERLEAALGPVEEGVRFGDPARTRESGGPASTGVAGAWATGESDDEPTGDFVVADLPAGLVETGRGIDADGAWDAVAETALAFDTDNDGTLVGDRVALRDRADRRAIVESLAAVLEARYDAVTVTDQAVVAERSAFDPAAARELGVPEGPAFGKLSAGQSVEVDGRTVDPADVHAEETERFPY